MRALDRLDRHSWEANIDEIVVAAGQAIIPYWRRAGLAVNNKSDASPVTEADLKAHRLIVQGLSKLAADIPVLSEEEESERASSPAYQALSAGATYWLVDPLDGTKEFVAGLPEFTVNIALMERGHPIAGWLYAPALGMLFKALAGRGAKRLGPDMKASAISTRRADPDNLRVFVSRSANKGEAEALKQRFPEVQIDAIGSSYKYALIAAGEADLSVRRTPTMLWDTAAADCILSEAGGRVMAWDGCPLDYARADLTNPPFLAVGDPSSNALRRFAFLVGRE